MAIGHRIEALERIVVQAHAAAAPGSRAAASRERRLRHCVGAAGAAYGARTRRAQTTRVPVRFTG